MRKEVIASRTDDGKRRRATASDSRRSPGKRRPAVAYLGSKARQAGWIASYISSVLEPGARVADVFSGTAAVSVALKASNLSVVANDHLEWAYHAARAALLNDRPPTFVGLPLCVEPYGADRYDAILSHLEDLAGADGFVPREYSPSGPAARRYLTAENARRIQAIRRRIGEWAACLAPQEFSLLLSDLLVAVSAVSNTAGTYGSYLKEWKAPALFPLTLYRSSLVPSGPGATHEVHSDDANELVRRLSVDAVYADPPYTKRQYAAYYHVLETIAAGDEPSVTGSTGLRPWEHLSSPYCLRRHAARALADLVSNSSGRHFFLSYNADGQIRHDEILEILSAQGLVALREFKTRRYRSSEIKGQEPHVVERFYHLDRGAPAGARKWLR